MIRPLKTTSGEQGAVLVEMAFALPLLALVFLCIIDLGLVVREYQLVQNAAREAARYSALPANQMSLNANPAAILNDIKSFAVQYAANEHITINPGNVQVDQNVPIPTNCGSQITITYQRPMLLLGAPILPTTTITLTARAIFYNLYGC